MESLSDPDRLLTSLGLSLGLGGNGGLADKGVKTIWFKGTTEGETTGDVGIKGDEGMIGDETVGGAADMIEL